jgi:hypothetical protein
MLSGNKVVDRPAHHWSVMSLARKNDTIIAVTLWLFTKTADEGRIFPSRIEPDGPQRKPNNTSVVFSLRSTRKAPHVIRHRHSEFPMIGTLFASMTIVKNS